MGRHKQYRPATAVSMKGKAAEDIIAKLKEQGILTDDQIQSVSNAVNDSLTNYTVNEHNIDENRETPTYEKNAEIMELFIASKRVEARSHSTLYNYQNEISKLFLFVNKLYKDIDSNDIRRYMDYRKQHDGLANVSVQNIRMYLLSFFKWLQVEDYIIKNPMDKIGVIKVEKHVIETLSDEEQEMIRCACTSERDLAIIDLLSSSGMRVSELCGLDRDNVDFINNEVKVFSKGAKERMCFFTGRCKVHLQWYLDSRTDDNPALFVTTKAPYKRLTKNGVEYILREIAKNSKVPKIRLYPHKYRSTLATNMINKGASADKVQNILGHASVDTTLSCYARVDKETTKHSHHVYVS